MPPKKFSLELGFFVVMGGIAVDVTELMNDEKRLRLLPDAILFLAKEGAFVDIPSAFISEKSKADLLRKGLVYIQVIWFLVQCVGRKAARYPVALLEIHSVVHVVCALLMYTLWWKVRLEVSKDICISL